MGDDPDITEILDKVTKIFSAIQDEFSGAIQQDDTRREAWTGLNADSRQRLNQLVQSEVPNAIVHDESSFLFNPFCPSY